MSDIHIKQTLDLEYKALRSQEKLESLQRLFTELSNQFTKLDQSLTEHNHIEMAALISAKLRIMKMEMSKE